MIASCMALPFFHAPEPPGGFDRWSCGAPASRFVAPLNAKNMGTDTLAQSGDFRCPGFLACSRVDCVWERVLNFPFIDLFSAKYSQTSPLPTSPSMPFTRAWPLKLATTERGGGYVVQVGICDLTTHLPFFRSHKLKFPPPAIGPIALEIWKSARVLSRLNPTRERNTTSAFFPYLL